MKIFPDRFCADTRPYWFLFLGFAVSAGLLVYTLYMRQPERYRGIWRLLSGESSDSFAAPDIQMAGYMRLPRNPATVAVDAMLSWNQTGQAAKPETRFLGMTLTDMPEGRTQRQAAEMSSRGVLVTAVDSRSLSYVCGFQAGDLIMSVNRISTPTLLDFQRVSSGLDFSQGVLFDICRNGKLLYMTLDTRSVAQ